ncbi:MAG: FKBP-type peptidyl-prolyl cis-trans isomerase [Candidatus Hodarchaeales archaeon]
MNKIRTGLIVFLTLVMVLTANQTDLVNASISGGFSEGDVVAVHYILTLYGFQGSGTEEFIQEGDLGVDDASQAVTVSSSQTQYLQKFVDPIFGMYVGETKQFIIDKKYGYSSGELAYKDLYYEITIIKLWYDAIPLISAEGSTTSSTTTTTTATTTETAGFQLDSMMIMGILGGLGIIGGGGLLFLTRIKPSGYNQIRDVARSSIEKERSQLQEISKILEEKRSVAGLDEKPLPPKRKRSARRRR